MPDSDTQPHEIQRRFSIREILFIVAVAFLCIAIFLAVVSFNLFQFIGMGDISSYNPFTPGESQAESTQSPGGSSSDAETSSLPPPPEWDGSTRVTILLMGLDYRDWIANVGPSRTDTMMLLTIDPISKTAGVLSIPRDLWANIPGFNPQKINAAYRYGEIYKYPGGGPGLAIKTVEGTIGVPIDYYAVLDFSAFIKFIDLISGIKIEVKEPIELEVIGKPVDVYLEPGVYVIGGDIALAYARNRSTGGGDFERAERQQQVIMGIRDRLLEPKIFSVLMENAPELYEQITTGVKTNLPLEDAIKLAFLAVQIPDEGIVNAILDESSFIYGRSPDDLSILIPLPDKIRVIRDKVFSTGGAFTPLMVAEPDVLLQLESPTITIRNGTNNSALTSRTADYLRSQGAQITSSSPADGYYAHTTIILYQAKPYSLAYLVDLMNINHTKILHEFNPNSAVDIEIILGEDWLQNNPMP
ncbi:MAG: LCP family protein [Anaerolineales bacterium]|jgi:LCP family protein required for cell wall assembly